MLHPETQSVVGSELDGHLKMDKHVSKRFVRGSIARYLLGKPPFPQLIPLLCSLNVGQNPVDTITMCSNVNYTGPGRGAMHHSLDLNHIFHCDRNYGCTRILGANVTRLIRLSSGDLTNSSNKSELLSVYMMQLESTLKCDLH